MQKRKERAFNEHKELIQCLWYIGKGIMFRKHLIKYFTLHGHQKRKVEEAIRDLIASDLVEVSRYGNSHVLKLKKYGIYTLQGKKSSDVDSVRIGGKKILRSAFLNERILGDLALDPNSTHLAKGFAHSLRRIQLVRSHASFEKRSYKILVYIQGVDQRNEKRGESKKFLASAALEEIKDLIIVREYTEGGKWEEEARAIRINKESAPGYKINLNGLHSRDVYFSFSRDGRQYILNLDLPDIQSNMTEKQLEKKLKLVIPYVKYLIDPAVQIQVNVLVASDIRRDYFESKMNRIATNVSRATNINDVEMQTINLNLEETLFARMTIIS